MKIKGFFQSHKRRITVGAMLLFFCAICSLMTVLFIYSNNQVRNEYRSIADKRDEKVERLGEQVGELQKKLDHLPEQTAEKTVDKVKPLVEDEKK